MKTKTRVTYRCAKTGRFVSAKTAKRRPATTVAERVRRCPNCGPSFRCMDHCKSTEHRFRVGRR